MKRTKKTASVRKAGKGRRPRRGRVQARTATTAAKPRRVATRARAGGTPRTGSPYSDAVRGLQEAAASLADRDIIEILSDLSWPSRAKWLSSYFEDQLPEEIAAGGDGIEDSLAEIGRQVAALLTALDAEEPTDFLSAVTLCFSADPLHAAAGSSWLRANLGVGAIDLDALDGLPGYQAIAESLERVRGEPSAD